MIRQLAGHRQALVGYWLLNVVLLAALLAFASR
jgi:hypothetical protein